MRPELPERNVQLLQDTMAHVEQHPEEHNQDCWVNPCGTAFCYAGHAAILAGAARPTRQLARSDNAWFVDPETLESVGTRQPSESAVEVGDFAELKLGITNAESEVLFDGYRTVKELRKLVDALCANAWIDDNVDIWIDGENRGDVEDWLEAED